MVHICDQDIEIQHIQNDTLVFLAHEPQFTPYRSQYQEEAYRRLAATRQVRKLCRGWTQGCWVDYVNLIGICKVYISLLMIVDDYGCLLVILDVH